MLGKTALYRMDERGKQCGADFIKINVKTCTSSYFVFCGGRSCERRGCDGKAAVGNGVT